MALPALAVGTGLLVPSGAAEAGPVLGGPPTYPDLVPTVNLVYVDRPFLGVDPVTGENRFGPPELRFDTWSQNLGTVALDLLADDPSDPISSTVSQCTTWIADNVCLERRQVGGFSWHEAHTHFHFEDFARYELRRLRRNGRVDYSSRGLLAVSDKVSFCLIDTVQVRDDALPAPTYTGFCNPFRQGISSGWADIYWDGVPGQQLPLDGLSDGRYALVLTLNPAGALYEADYGNNTVEAVIELSGGVTTVSIVERRWP